VLDFAAALGADVFLVFAFAFVGVVALPSQGSADFSVGFFVTEAGVDFGVGDEPPSSILRATFLAPLDTALAPAPTALFSPLLSADPILPSNPGLLDPVSVELDDEELVCGDGDGVEELLPAEEPPLPLSYPLENSLPTAFAPLTAAPAT
jgi:hypothetical protein